MDYALRFEVVCDKGGFYRIVDSDGLYHWTGPLPKEEAYALAAELNSKE